MRRRIAFVARVAGLTGSALLVPLCALHAPVLWAQANSGSAEQATRTTTSFDVARGKAVYDVRCVDCHGATGKGDGPAAHLLTPHPRDFTTGRYKIRSTESGSLPTDEDLRHSVRQGLPGTAMPAWQGLLSDEDVIAVVDYVESLSPRFQNEQPQLVAVPEAAGAGRPRASGTRHPGAAVYEKLQCGKCHGSDGRGAGAVVTEFEDDWRQPLRATDLTQPWTFHGGATTRDVFLRFRTGLSGTPMPSFKDAASDARCGISPITSGRLRGSHSGR